MGLFIRLIIKDDGLLRTEHFNYFQKVVAVQINLSDEKLIVNKSA